MPATDNFRTHAQGIVWPGSGAFAITPHDTNELTNVTRALWVGGAGNVKVTMENGDTVTFSGVAAGTLLPLRVRLVFTTGTTATLMIGVV